MHFNKEITLLKALVVDEKCILTDPFAFIQVHFHTITFTPKSDYYRDFYCFLFSSLDKGIKEKYLSLSNTGMLNKMQVYSLLCATHAEHMWD